MVNGENLEGDISVLFKWYCHRICQERLRKFTFTIVSIPNNLVKICTGYFVSRN